MIIKDFVRKDDGSCSFTFEVNDEEAHTLMEFAIRQLISVGVIDLDDQGDVEDEVDSYINSGGKLS